MSWSDGRVQVTSGTYDGKPAVVLVIETEDGDPQGTQAVHLHPVEVVRLVHELTARQLEALDEEAQIARIVDLLTRPE